MLLATTVPEIIGRRYGTPAHIITTFLSLATLFVATAAQIKATSAIIETISGGDFVTVTIMVAIVVTLYTMLGGLVSVAFTDIVHILFITVGMAIAMPIILQGAGGWETVSANIAATAPQKLGLTEVGWKNIIGLILMYFMTFFDPATIIDKGTYQEPRQYPLGIKHVLVNGTPVVRDSKPLTDQLPGKVLRRS